LQNGLGGLISFCAEFSNVIGRLPGNSGRKTTMAQPFIVLGLKGANKLIDKHYDKVPDKILHPETYHPANLISKQRRQRTREKRAAKNRAAVAAGAVAANSSSSSDDEDSVEDITRGVDDSGMQKQSQRGVPSNMNSPSQNATYSPQTETYAEPPLYSREPSRLRPEYAPSPPPVGSGYPYARGAYTPPPFESQSLDQRSRRDSYGDEDYYSDSARHPRRPKAVTRRSSSYHGPRGDNQLARRSGTGSEHADRARDKAHRYGLKEEVGGFFTKSKEGLAGGAVGALVGGWAAHKAQEAKGREKHGSSPLVTLLGAAVGGLAVNAVIDKWEDGKKDTSEKQEKWNEKWPERGIDNGADSDGARSHRSHRSKGSRGSRYDDGYGSDEESDGGRSNRSHRRHRASKGSDSYD
jgi:hypothetical protein